MGKGRLSADGGWLQGQPWVLRSHHSLVNGPVTLCTCHVLDLLGALPEGMLNEALNSLHEAGFLVQVKGAKLPIYAFYFLDKIIGHGLEMSEADVNATRRMFFAQGIQGQTQLNFSLFALQVGQNSGQQIKGILVDQPKAVVR